MVEAPAHDSHGHDAHGHDDHGHGGAHPSSLTMDRSALLGVVAAFLVGIVAAMGQAKAGPFALLAKSGGEEEEGERLAYPTPQKGDAAVLFVNANVLQPGYEPATVIACDAAGTIIGVGGDELLMRRTSSTVVHDLHGGTIVPGLRDAHGSLAALGRRLKERVCDLSGADSMGDMVQRFSTWMRIRGSRKPGAWLLGTGWDEAGWKVLVEPSRADLAKAEKEGHDFSKDPNQGYRVVADQLPDSTMELDRVAPQNPVLLERAGGGTIWVNRRALEAAGITHESFDPPGGRIVRDATGEPSGILMGTAADLVWAKVTPPSQEDAVNELAEDIEAACRACARAGIVEVHEAGVGMNEEIALRRLAKDGKLPIRVYAMVSGDRASLAERLTARPWSGDFLSVRAVTLRADLTFATRGARLLEPYSDTRSGGVAPDWKGFTIASKEEIKKIAHVCAERGWQLCVEATGDAAVHDVLEVYEEALKGKQDARWRIEHAQIVAPEDRERFAKLGVLASVQPAHLGEDARIAEARLGSAPVRVDEKTSIPRWAETDAWRSLLEGEVKVAFGTDFPALPERPLLGLLAAVRREDEHGKPEGGWGSKEKLSFARALELFTAAPAWASFAEARRGKLLPGMDCDITVLNMDPSDALEDAKTAQKLAVVETYVAGKNVR
ncbi:MAG TPA: amidohydrolase [Planctomycetota bacterium]|nr:amidohydrolase [Planctomycetota bacterium]